MKILYAASEATPFIKTGGLADVAGSLPLAIKESEHDIRVVVPYYSKINHIYKKDMKKELEFFVDLGWRNQYVSVLSYKTNGCTFYFIDNEYYFDRYNIYGEYDDGERFIYFSKAIAKMIKELNFKPDIINSNDWHTGLLPLFIKDFAKVDLFYSDIKTVFTIHNLKYQGVFPESILEIAGLSKEYNVEDGLKFYDSINFMKAGIVYADAVTTVSKTYAEEIKTEFFGENLYKTIRDKEYKLSGIVNGIDYNIYNPETDPNIVKNYNVDNLQDKELNKLAIQELYNLPVNKDIPVIAMVSRLVKMKGLDLVPSIFDELLQEDIQFIVLGTGDKEYEELFSYYQEKYPDKVASRMYFNEKESHQIYSGADIFLMPSLAEPCGISQLISLRYGTIPLVREVGGLKDTVTPYNEITKEGNGFSFTNFNAHDLLFTIKRALSLYENKELWKSLMIKAMNSKNDWEKSSEEYIALYKSLQADCIE